MSGNGDRRADRWALLIGIDRYLHMPEWELKGAVRDVEAFAEHLSRRQGFLPEHVLKLTNAEASRAGIRSGMEWLEDKLSPNDLAVVFYSGHGSWRADSKTSKRRADGREKTLVPCDSGRHPLPSLDIGGDELHEWLRKLVGQADPLRDGDPRLLPLRDSYPYLRTTATRSRARHAACRFSGCTGFRCFRSADRDSERLVSDVGRLHPDRCMSQ